MRINNIDLVKGSLIILVIIGHILQGELQNSLPRTIIYSFHMPLFIGISGFLFNGEKFLKFNFSGLLNKYWLRVILPWLIAMLIYNSFSALQNNEFSISSFMPFYHLWYIPAFLSWVVLTWYFGKIGLGKQNLLILGFIISILFELLNIYPELYSGFENLSRVVDASLKIFRPYYYFFFVLGYFLKHNKLAKPYFLYLFFTAIGFVMVVYNFFYPMVLLNIGVGYFINIFLLLLILKLCKNNRFGNSRFLEWIGINSLGIYLWHVIPILICKKLFTTDNLFSFYMFTVCAEFVFLLIYFYLSRIPFFKKYFFGL